MVWKIFFMPWKFAAMTFLIIIALIFRITLEILVAVYVFIVLVITLVHNYIKIFKGEYETY